MAHQFVSADAVVRRYGYADGGGHADILATKRKRRCKGLVHAFRQR